jgi:integrase
MRLYRIKGGTYYVAFPGNRRRSLKTKDKATAERLFNRLKKEALLGNIIQIDRAKQVGLFTFRDEYLKYSKTHKSESTYVLDTKSFRTLCDHLGNVPLNTITPKRLEDLHVDMRNAGRAPAGVNILIRHLRAAFSVAVDWDYLKSNPYSKVKQLKIIKTAPRFLSEDEIKRIMAEIKEDQDFHDLITMYLLTGMRRSELAFLEKKDIDFNTNLIYIRKSKTGWRTIPMIDRVREILEKRCDGQGIVFANWKPNAITRRWCRLMNRLQIDCRLHDLRHTAASYLIMSGVDVRTVQEILGHSQITTTQIYTHLLKDHVSNALSELEKRLKNSMTKDLAVINGGNL